MKRVLGPKTVTACTHLSRAVIHQPPNRSKNPLVSISICATSAVMRSKHSPTLFPKKMWQFEDTLRNTDAPPHRDAHQKKLPKRARRFKPEWTIRIDSCSCFFGKQPNRMIYAGNVTSICGCALTSLLSPQDGKLLGTIAPRTATSILTAPCWHPGLGSSSNSLQNP